MFKRRLLKLADLLEADAKNPKGIKFDLSTWGSAADPDKPVSCGTVACAMGLAVVSGAFRRAGLVACGGRDMPLCPQMPSGSRGFGAASELFDIKRTEAEWLFDISSYSWPHTGKRGELKVAKRIRDFVAGKAKPTHPE